jgi:Flp pilus assembly pilin Flp
MAKLSDIANARTTLLTKLARDKRGAGFTEYLILVGLVAIFCIGAFTAFGGAISDKATEFEADVTGL